jgi:hypothetical protein
MAFVGYEIVVTVHGWHSILRRSQVETLRPSALQPVPSRNIPIVSIDIIIYNTVITQVLVVNGNLDTVFSEIQGNFGLDHRRSKHASANARCESRRPRMVVATPALPATISPQGLHFSSSSQREKVQSKLQARLFGSAKAKMAGEEGTHSPRVVLLAVQRVQYCNHPLHCPVSESEQSHYRR